MNSCTKLHKSGLSYSYFGIFDILTFKNSNSLRDIAKCVPMERLLVETDAPYLAPTPFRGKRNEPAYVKETANVLAGVKGVAESEIHNITTNNFFRLFSKVPDPRLNHA